MRQREHKINLLRPHSGDPFEEVVDTEDEDNDGSDTIDPGGFQEYVRDELEVLAATCMDNGEKRWSDSRCGQFTVGNSVLETC